MKIITAPNSGSLGDEINKSLNLEKINLSYKHFYDGETYLRIEDSVKDEEIILLQSTYPDQEKSFLELMFINSTLKEFGADKIIAIVPYLSYARADKRKLEGEVLSHQLSVSYLKQSGLDTIVTVNVHNHDLFLNIEEELEKYSLNALTYLVENVMKRHNKGNWVIVGPDFGSKEDVSSIAKEFSLPFCVMEKERDASTHLIKTKKPEFDFSGKNAILVDDIVSSGSTAKEACRLILEGNADSVSLIFVHVLSKPEVIKEIFELGNVNIYSSNTIARSDLEQIDISPIITKLIEEKFL